MGGEKVTYSDMPNFHVNYLSDKGKVEEVFTFKIKTEALIKFYKLRNSFVAKEFMRNKSIIENLELKL